MPAAPMHGRPEAPAMTPVGRKSAGTLGPVHCCVPGEQGNA
jgi:hypothetical protein